MYVNVPVVPLYCNAGVKLALAVVTLRAPKLVVPPLDVVVVVLPVFARFVVVFGGACIICPDALNPASPG